MTVILSLANGALNCSIVGLALPLFGPGPAGLAALLELLLKFLVACLATVGALARAAANNRDEVFMAPISDVGGGSCRGGV